MGATHGAVSVVIYLIPPLAIAAAICMQYRASMQQPYIYFLVIGAFITHVASERHPQQSLNTSGTDRTAEVYGLMELMPSCVQPQPMSWTT